MFDSFDNICFGIVLPIIILVGLIGNIIALCVLSHRFLRNSPVFLLKVLVFHGILTMCYSIYIEVVPIIKTYFSEGPKLFHSNYDYLDTYGFEEALSNVSSLMSFDGIRTPYEGYQHRLIERDDNNTFHNYVEGNESYYDFYLIRELGIFHDMEKEAKYFTIESIKSYVSYFLIHAGLFLTLLITAERCIAVHFPMKAVVWLTVDKTRIVTLISLIICVSMHIPQLTKEILFQEEYFNRSTTGLLNSKSIISPIRRGYIMFFVYSSSVICICTFLLNISLLIRLYHMKKIFKGCKHTQRSDGNENNITVATVVLVFFELPFHVFSTVIYELRFKYVSDNIDDVFKVLEVGRLLYIAHSALNFVVYCLMAKNCRHVFRLILKRFSKQNISRTAIRKNPKSPRDSVQREMENIPLNDISVKTDRAHVSWHASLTKTLTDTSLMSTNSKRLSV